MNTQNKKAGRATARRWQTTAVTLCVLMAALISQVAVAGGFKTGSFTSAADLGLNVGFPPPQSLVLAEHGGGTADGQDTVGAVTFNNPSTMFGQSAPGHTWGNANFGDAQLNDLVSGVLVAHSVFGQSLSKTFSGLTVGHDYRLRLIVFDGDSGAVNSGQRLSTINAGSDSLPFDYEGVIGGSWVDNKGAYIDYQWIYSSPLTVTWAGNAPDLNQSNYTVILSAFALSELPEPSAVMLLGIGGLLLSRRTRRLA